MRQVSMQNRNGVKGKTNSMFIETMPYKKGVKHKINGNKRRKGKLKYENNPNRYFFVLFLIEEWYFLAHNVVIFMIYLVFKKENSLKKYV